MNGFNAECAIHCPYELFHEKTPDRRRVVALRRSIWHSRGRLVSSLPSTHMPEAPIYPSVTLDGDGPPTWFLLIENWFDYPMRDLSIIFGTKRWTHEEQRETLDTGAIWPIALTQLGRLFEYHYMQRKPAKRDIRYRLVWRDRLDVEHEMESKVYLVEGMPGLLDL